MTEARQIGGMQAAELEDNHTGETVEALKRGIMDNLYYRRPGFLPWPRGMIGIWPWPTRCGTAS